MNTLHFRTDFLSLKFLFIIILFTPLSLLSQQKYSEIYDSAAFIETGKQFHQAGDYQKAIEQYEKIYKTDSDYLVAQYEKALSLTALEKTDEALALLEKLYSENLMPENPELFILYGTLLSDKEDYEMSEKVYKEAETIIPDATGLLYNMAIMYIRKQEVQKAVDYLKKVVTNNPNHASSHYILGILAYENGKVVEGSLAMLGYLSNFPTGRFAYEALKRLNTNMGQHYLTTTDVVFSEKGDDFSELELILRNQLPLNSKYKLKVDIDDVVTRQIQAIVEYASTHEVKDGFFENIYIPFLADIQNKKYTEQFIYYTLIAAEENLGKKLTNHKKKILEFNDNYIRNHFRAVYTKRKIEHFGSVQEVSIYFEEEYPYLVGADVNGVLQGKFKMLNKLGQITGELNYKDGKLDGLQTYYYSDGAKFEEVTYSNGIKNGIYKEYYKNGNLKSEATFKNDVLDGEGFSYFMNGGKRCVRPIKEGKLTGLSVCYYPNGTKQSEYEYLNDKLNGKAIDYNEQGDIISSYYYLDGLLNGEAITYYDGKIISSQTNYDKGYAVQSYKEFYENGQPKKEFLLNGTKVDKVIEYHPNGKMQSETFYDNKEQTDKYVYYNESGEKYFEERYRNGKVRAGYQYTKNNTEPTEVSISKKEFEIKDLDGNTRMIGAFAKGMMNGEWTYFDSNGLIKTKQHFEDDLTKGLRYDYERGKINGIYYQEKGNLIGLYEGFSDENLFVKMYFNQGQRNGPYQYFYRNGNVDYEGYLIDGKAYLKHFSYFQDGTICKEAEYFEDYLINLKNFNKDGTLESEISYANKNGLTTYTENGGLVKVTVEHKNGIRNGNLIIKDKSDDLILTSTYVNDVIHGKYIKYYPNQKLALEGEYYNGKNNGLFKYHDLNGKLRLTVEYILGKEFGKGTRFYQNGKTLYQYNMVNDQKNGEQTFYNLDGKVIALIGYEMDTPKYYKVLTKDGSLGEAQKIDLKSEVEILSKYADGKTAFKLRLKKGYFDKTMEIYGTSGQPHFISEYAYGKINGKRTEYYTNGKIYKIENFNAGSFEGLQEYFSEDGKTIISAEYSWDELHGNFKTFKNGNLVMHKIYDSDELVEIKK